MALRAGDFIISSANSLTLQTLDAKAVATSQHFDQGVGLVGGGGSIGVATGSADKALAQARAEKHRGGGGDGGGGG